MEEQAKKQVDLSLYEKKIEAQLDAPLANLRTEISKAPDGEAKRTAKGKMFLGLVIKIT